MQLLPGKAEGDSTTPEHRRAPAARRQSFTKSRRNLPLIPGPTTLSNVISSSTRLYKAPQALVRNDNYVNAKQEAVGARRRRRRGPASTTQSTATTEVANNASADLSTTVNNFSTLDHNESDSSLGNTEYELPAPPLWGDEEDFLRISPYTRRKDTIPEIAWARTPSRTKSRQSSIHLRSGCEDHSDNTVTEEDLCTGYDTQHLHTHLHTHDHVGRCCPPLPPTSMSLSSGKRRTFHGRWWSFSHPYANMIQCLVLLLLAFLVFDSHHRVHKHKIQLQEYDEERAHILEQMMWIDQAAKKVHKKYSTQQNQGGSPDVASSSSLLLQPDVDASAHAALEKLQLRIQLNARDRLAQRFGDKPAEISLKLNNEGEHLIVALSDDTPHAVSILLEQVERRVWDSIRVEKSLAVGAVQIAATRAATTPMLEFVEPSRGCHEIGSVAMQQQIDDGLHVLKLRVNLIANSPMEPDHVCIGRAVSSLATLQEMAIALK